MTMWSGLRKSLGRTPVDTPILVADAVPWREEKYNPTPRLAEIYKLLLPYLRIARIDHWVKNIFMIPGVAVGLLFVRPPAYLLASHVVVGMLSLCFLASANYTINEYLDSEFDRFHPTKKDRAGAQGLLDQKWVTLQYFLLAVPGMALAYGINWNFTIIAAILLLAGIVYNVRPFRTKDRQYLDVLSESINNPLRLLLGWFTVVSAGYPPSSTILAYWMGGCFLMAVKRYTEFRSIDNPALAGQYRRSFLYYTEESLLVSAFFYAVCSAFFLAVFLIKYRVELLLIFPLLSAMFSWYLAIGLKKNSAAQAPERLFHESRFMTFVMSIGAVTALLFHVNIPVLHFLLDPINIH
jgi:4-hydroxybenzoate polyprenyltransferase